MIELPIFSIFWTNFVTGMVLSNTGDGMTVVPVNKGRDLIKIYGRICMDNNFLVAIEEWTINLSALVPSYDVSVPIFDCLLIQAKPSS